MTKVRLHRKRVFDYLLGVRLIITYKNERKNQTQVDPNPTEPKTRRVYLRSSVRCCGNDQNNNNNQ